MPDSFDAYEYIRYLQQRWWYCAIACGVAVVAAVVGCAAVTKQYSATASILIEPPASSDVRTAVAVSPVYLESLRTYEYFARSDSLFQRAVEQFRLKDADPTEPIESLKKRVLKVSKVRDTKVLEITATLPDPQRAARLAAFLAEQTAELSRFPGREGDQDLVHAAQRQADSSGKAVEAMRTELQRTESDQPAEGRQREVESLIELRASVERDLLQARADLAEGGSAGLQKRIAELTRQSSDLAARLETERRRSGRIAARKEALGSDLAAAVRERDVLQERVGELQSGAGTRGERLRVIDSGVVPQRPSYPNVPLSVASAFLLSAVASLLYLSAGFSIAQRRRASVRLTRPEHEHRY